MTEFIGVNWFDWIPAFAGMTEILRKNDGITPGECSMCATKTENITLSNFLNILIYWRYVCFDCLVMGDFKMLNTTTIDNNETLEEIILTKFQEFNLWTEKSPCQLDLDIQDDCKNEYLKSSYSGIPKYYLWNALDNPDLLNNFRQSNSEGEKTI